MLEKPTRPKAVAMQDRNIQMTPEDLRQRYDLDNIVAMNSIDAIIDTINTEIPLKAPLESPTFTGTVSLPATTSIGSVSNTEIGYLDGVTSAIQTQFASMFINKGAVITDFNTYTTNGMYTYGGGTTLANRPPDYGLMVVFATSDYKVQLVINGISKIYFRFNNGTNWSGWKTITGV